MLAREGSDSCTCPFLNDDDPRCRAHFSLRQIAQTFDLCLDRYRACPLYYTLRYEDRLAESLPLVAEVTVEGREASAGHAA